MEKNRIFGKNPLKGGNYKETFKNNSNCSFEIPPNSISEEMKDLILKSTVKDPKKRMSLKEFESHDLFACNISDSEDFIIKYEPSKYL